VFIAALFTIGKLWKQPRCPTTDEWIKNMWYLYTMEFYSATNNGILLFADKWLELENITLSKVSQVQKAKGCMFSLIYRPNKNTTLLWEAGHVKGRSHMREGG
jgi:hypothetical protein